MAMLLDAIETVAMGPQRKALKLSPETKKIVAYHESGHALVKLNTPGDPLVKASLIPRGKALGFVWSQAQDEHLRKKPTYLANLDTAMGGRVAEELIFGKENVTAGGCSDFQTATRIARDMVMNSGLSSLGTLALTEAEFNNASQETKAAIEKEIQLILKTSHDRTRNLLTPRRKELELLANALLQYETLTAEEVKLAVQGKDITNIRKQQKEKQEIEEARKLVEQQQLQVHEPELQESTQNT